MQPPLRSFRIVCPAGQESMVLELLEKQGFRFSQEPFHPLAFLVEHEPMPLGQSLAAFFGLIYIQNRSSMLPPVMLDPGPGSTVLDMCASPGGKTGFAAQITGPDGFVLGVEPSADRLATLRQNLFRLALANTATTKAQAEDLGLNDESFDNIVLDPPCSGWGTADIRPKVLDVWSEEKTGPLVALQKELLARAAGMVKPGGKIMYSTCTTNVLENEEQVRWALDNLNLELDRLAPPKGFTLAQSELGLDRTIRIDGPGLSGQGFYLARFTKKDPATQEMTPVDQDLPGHALSRKKLKALGPYAWDGLPEGRVYDFSGRVMFLHHRALEIIPGNVRWQGLMLGRLAGDEFHPSPRARGLMAPADKRALVLDDIAGLMDLVQGRAYKIDKKTGGYIPLFYKTLGLGFAVAKSGRIVWSERSGRGAGKGSSNQASGRAKRRYK